MASQTKTAQRGGRRTGDPEVKAADNGLNRLIAVCTAASFVGGAFASTAVNGQRLTEIERIALVHTAEIDKQREEIKAIQIDYKPKLDVLANDMISVKKTLDSIESKLNDLVTHKNTH